MASLVGKWVTRVPHPLRNRGWKKYRVKCDACRGAGSVPCPDATYGVIICRGCNGHGQVIVWRNEESNGQTGNQAGNREAV